MALDRKLVSTDGTGAQGEPLTGEGEVERHRSEFAPPSYAEIRKSVLAGEPLETAGPRLRRARAVQPRDAAAEASPAVRSPAVPVRDLLSVVLTVAGVAALVTGAALLWGPGAAVLVAGGLGLLLGLLLGFR